jgi:hypothetical protein
MYYTILYCVTSGAHTLSGDNVRTVFRCIIVQSKLYLCGNTNGAAVYISGRLAAKVYTVPRSATTGLAATIHSLRRVI